MSHVAVQIASTCTYGVSSETPQARGRKKHFANCGRSSMLQIDPRRSPSPFLFPRCQKKIEHSSCVCPYTTILLVVWSVIWQMPRADLPQRYAWPMRDESVLEASTGTACALPSSESDGRHCCREDRGESAWNLDRDRASIDLPGACESRARPVVGEET